jgi:hypothetical protein
MRKNNVSGAPKPPASDAQNKSATTETGVKAAHAAIASEPRTTA